MFLQPDYNKNIPRPKLWLAKPNKEIITSLYEIEPTINYKINNINEITFNIPVFLNKEDYFNIDTTTDNFIGDGNIYPHKNPHIDLIHERDLIKVDYNGTVEWFIIIELNDTVAEDKDSIAVSCFSLGYQLKDSKINNYTTNSSSLRQMLMGNYLDGTKGILHDTSWTVGYIDERYNKVYRSLSGYSGTVLQAIIEDLRTTFQYVVEFDTENKLLNFYYVESYGRNTGIVFNENKYLKSLTRDRNADSDSMCTRLYCKGKDNLDISSINPTGQPYVDDFSFFMYPFEMDKQGNILKHSNQMSDDLCIAITKYQAKIMTYIGQIFKLTDKQTANQSLLIYKQQELSSLKNQKYTFADKLTVAQSAGTSTQPIIDIQEQIENDINNKNNEISTINNIIDNIQNQIDIIKVDLNEHNNFTSKQMQELSNFIICDTWSDEKYINVKDLYVDGLKQLKKKNKPKITINIDYVNFLECIDEQDMWKELKIGDKITIQYPLLNINTETKYGENEYSPDDWIGDL